MRTEADVSEREPGRAAGVGAVPVSTELLVPFFRVTRSPLASWAQTLLDRLAQARARSDDDWYARCDQIASCFNEASLIEAHFGRPDRADALCRREIAWADQLVIQTGRPAAAEFVFQPYINLGRLDRNRRDWDAALAKFRYLESFLSGESVQIGELVVTGEHARAIAASHPEFADQMSANYFIDTAITLLRAERFQDVSELVEHARDMRLEWVDDLLYEAATIARSRLGDVATALQRVDAYLQRPQRAHSAVFMYRRAELLSAAGDRAAAAKIAGALAVAHTIARVPVEKVNVRLIVQLAKLLVSLGDGRAASLARAGLSTAERLNDAIFQQELLALVASTAGSADQRSAAQARADAVRRCSGYGAARSASTTASLDPLPLTIDRVYERLMSIEDP